MRNWNPPTKRGPVGPLRASRLPMRNWNVSLFNSTTVIFGFQTTYEELKLYSGSYECIHISQLPDYLWGIETANAKPEILRAILLPDYLWGIETCVQQYSMIYFRLPDYLWGIETAWMATSWITLCFQTTYEELKQPELPGIFVGFEGFQTTYEELKLRCSCSQSMSLLLPDYLWGIETCVDPHSNRRQCRFQTTYEELKLRQLARKFQLKNCFQTTYEELKHSQRENGLQVRKLPDYLWGIETPGRSRTPGRACSFQTTYEELKQVCFACRRSLKVCASRLPMRNWNYFLAGSFLTASLPDYLWGIETSLYVYGVASTGHGFQTTYEELKRDRMDTPISTLVLPDYLWGIETSVVDVSDIYIWLPDYLWGIETLPLDKALWNMIVLPDYLWGIETRVCQLTHDPCKASRLPMRNWN